MNINPAAKTVLCYGDSNTWGAQPGNGKRYPADQRWTGVLQQTLGENYYIIEEGLNGRTTIYSDPEQPRKNGKNYLEVCLHTHKPIDLVIIMLGTNDVKNSYQMTKENIGQGIEELVVLAQNFLDLDDEMDPPVVLIVAPPLIKAKAAQDDPRMSEAPEKSALFASRYQEVAEKHGCHFLDASQLIESSDIDGYHLDQSTHQILGQALADEVNKILT